jgi:hypothetical protein
MDPGDLTQLIAVITAALVFGRVGLAFSRMIERRGSPSPALPDEAEDRIRNLEGECATLRQEVAELQERQDFTERALLHDPARAKPAPRSSLPDRA